MKCFLGHSAGYRRLTTRHPADLKTPYKTVYQTTGTLEGNGRIRAVSAGKEQFVVENMFTLNRT